MIERDGLVNALLHKVSEQVSVVGHRNILITGVSRCPNNCGDDQEFQARSASLAVSSGTRDRVSMHLKKLPPSSLQELLCRTARSESRKISGGMSRPSTTLARPILSSSTH